MFNSSASAVFPAASPEDWESYQLDKLQKCWMLLGDKVNAKDNKQHIRNVIKQLQADRRTLEAAYIRKSPPEERTFLIRRLFACFCWEKATAAQITGNTKTVDHYFRMAQEAADGSELLGSLAQFRLAAANMQRV